MRFLRTFLCNHHFKMTHPKTAIVIGFSFLLIAYPVTQRSYFGTEKRNKKEHGVFERTGKVVIIYTSQRSGSTFLGEFFNRNSKAFYLFEPLLPFSAHCQSQRREENKLNFLAKLSRCDFHDVFETYRRADNLISTPAKLCVHHGVCVKDRITGLLDKYSSLCEEVQSTGVLPLDMLTRKKQKLTSAKFYGQNPTCGFPLDTTIWSALCHSAELMSLKIIRVCSLSALVQVADHLSEHGNEVHIIDLVRDPRAIMHSALQLELNLHYLDERVDQVCGRLRQSLDFIKTHSANASDIKSLKISNTSYIRIRFEDIASNPEAMAENIYKHLGLELPVEVRAWIEESTKSPSASVSHLRQELKNPSITEEENTKILFRIAKILKAAEDPYGTIRDSNMVLTKWRRKMPMALVYRIQRRCTDVMERLGYKIIHNVDERNNLTQPLWDKNM